METNRYELRIGIMVLAAIVCLVLMTVFFGKQSIVNFGSDYTIQVRFQRTPGIKRNSPVFKNGVQIGRVSKVELVDQDREVEITLLLDKKRRIYTNEECRIRQTVIMGDASLEFVKIMNFAGKVEEIDIAIPLVGSGSGDIMNGITNIEGDLSLAIQNVSAAAENLGGFIERINAALGSTEEFQERRTRVETLFNETRATMASFRQVTDGVNQYVNDKPLKDNVTKIVNELPDVIERSRTLVGDSAQFVQDARKFVEKGSQSLEKLSGSVETFAKVSEQVGSDAPEIITSVKKTADRLSAFFDDLSVVLQTAQSSDGTIKRLMRDPALYEKLLATLDNAEKITEEADLLLRTEIRPITGNVRILTDKAARDPAVFIRNLLRKEPPVKNLPYWGGETVYEEPLVRSRCKIPFLNFRKPTLPTPVETVPIEEILLDGDIIEDGVIIEESAVGAIPPEGRIVPADPRYSEIRQASWNR
ncbi:MAG: MlaD family protein [Planctomycetaceae bacterium]|nr:MlaD family protein [Planctomycetaceae bacterium]